MHSIRLRVTAVSVGALVTALLLVGVGTAALLHHRAQSSLDQTLLAAAFAEAHPWQPQRFKNKLVGSPVKVQPWDPSKPAVDPIFYRQSVGSGRPVWVDHNSSRVLLLAVQQEELADPYVVVAQAPMVSLQQTVLPFLIPYASVSLLITGLTILFLFLAIHQALLPLSTAVKQISSVNAIDLQTRLDTNGPPEIQSLLHATNQLLDRLQLAFSLQASFTSQAAHELRTPITVLKGELELALRRERSVEEHSHILRRLQQSTARLQNLVEGLLLLARVRSGQIEQGRTVERASAPLHRALTQERETLEAAGCDTQVTIDADPELSIHVALLTTAVATLLRNIAQHAPGSTAHISMTTTAGSALSIQIQDNGPGTTHPQRMLELFAHGSDRGSLGLGLPIAREIARRHGGELRFRSVLGEGTTAILTLPTQNQGYTMRMQF